METRVVGFELCGLLISFLPALIRKLDEKMVGFTCDVKMRGPRNLYPRRIIKGHFAEQ